jgi:hypothetical protein
MKRGAIIDEDALDAGLDVPENEPELHPALVGNANVVPAPARPPRPQHKMKNPASVSPRP